MPDSAKSSSITTISERRTRHPLAGAMVMAAGLGTRLRPFTEHCPKPLLPLMGTPMLQFAIDSLTASGLGIEKLVLNHSHLSARFVEEIPNLAWGGLNYELSDESRLLLGSGGGLRRALDILGADRPFLMMNADVLSATDLSLLLDSHLRLRASHGVALTLAIQPCSPGVGEYREILCRWDPRAPELGLVVGTGRKDRGVPFYTGVAIIEPELLVHLPANRELEFVPAILEPAIQAGKVGAVRTEGLWYDIGSPDLWLATHIDLIRRMETGHLPFLWRRRIELGNKRLADGVWISKRTPHSMGSHLRLDPPVYLDAAVPHSRGSRLDLGPEAVAYWHSDSPESFSHGIHWNGITWRR